MYRLNDAAARETEEDKRRQGFQTEGGRAIIKSRASDNGREGGVGMKRKNKGNMVQDDKTRSGWRGKQQKSRRQAKQADP